MKTYRGCNAHSVFVRDGDKPEVQLPIEPSLKLRNHSPTGFSWHYCGSGPAQLALALVLDVFNDPEFALAHYQNFKFDVVGGLPPEWTLTEDDIRNGNYPLTSSSLCAMI